MRIDHIKNVGIAVALTAAFAVSATAQDPVPAQPTQKTVVQNADGTWTVVEYPVGKEVIVELTPNNIKGATASARVLRSADGTKIWMDLNGLNADTKSFYAYAIGPSGVPTLLGPVMVADGKAKAEFSTPMNQFMLVLSPNDGVTTFTSDVPVVFRSAVPMGYAVVPVSTTSLDGGSKEVATTVAVTASYEVPMINAAKFDEDKDSEIRIAFNGELAGLKGKAYLTPTKEGVTKIKMRFDDMKLAPKDKRLILWAASPEGKYTKLGQVINAGGRQESEIRSETSMREFGLFVTLEEADVSQPASKIYDVFRASL